MPRSPRIHIKDALYYITCRVDSNEKIFQDKEDYDMFLKLLEKYKPQHEFKLFAYALMPDHLHLLMELPKGNLSELMHDINSSYTKYFNGRYDRKGHLFRERFRAALIEKDPYLAKVSAYVHLNPKELKMAEDLKSYPYSSYCFYLEKEEGKTPALDMAGEINEILGYLKETGYADFVQSLDLKEKTELHKRLHRQGIVGSDAFVKRIKEEMEQARKSAEPPKQIKIFPIAAALAVTVVLVASGLVYVLRVAGKNDKKITQDLPADRGINTAEDLVSTQWQILLTSSGGGFEVNDTVSFLGGKFISSKLYPIGYQASNYSLIIEANGKLIWETMQTAQGGTASWRGEIENGVMRGALSRRSDGKPAEDFTFISSSYRRIK